MLNELTNERMKELMSERIKEERIMKSIMKTIMRNTKLVMILAFLPALLSAAQAQAVDYKNNYRGVQQTGYRVQTVTTTVPAATFQSTSAFSDQWNTEEGTTPMLNSDGTVNESAYMSGNHLPGRSVRRTPGTPGGELDPNAQQPLGDGLMAMMLCACAYLVVRATRREENIGD